MQSKGKLIDFNLIEQQIQNLNPPVINEPSIPEKLNLCLLSLLQPAPKEKPDKKSQKKTREDFLAVNNGSTCKYNTQAQIQHIKGCDDEKDANSVLTNICSQIFQIRQDYEFDH